MNKRKSIKQNAILSGIKQLMTLLFPLITVPYITRVLGVENYGKINFGNSIVVYFSLIAGLGISTYAVVEGAKKRNDLIALQKFASEMFSINILSTVISSVILFVVLLVVDDFTEHRFLILVQYSYVLFIPFGVGWLNNVFEDFLYVTLRYIVIQLLSIVAMFFFVKKDNDYFIYACITSGSLILGHIVNYLYISKKYFKVTFTKKLNLKLHLKPIFILFASSIAIYVYVNSDITMLSLIRGDVETGIYSVSVKIYTIAKQLILSIITVLIPRISLFLKEEKINKYNELINRSIHFLVLITLPIVAGLFYYSRNVIKLIAGENYVIGYRELQILSVAMLVAVFSSFFVNAVMIPNQEENKVLRSTIFSAIINIGTNLIFIPVLGGTGAAITTLIAEMVVLICTFVVVRKLCTIKINIKQVMPCVIGVSIMILEYMFLTKLIKNDSLQLLLAVIISGGTYVLILVLFGDVEVTKMYAVFCNKIKNMKTRL